MMEMVNGVAVRRRAHGARHPPAVVPRGRDLRRAPRAVGPAHRPVPDGARDARRPARRRSKAGWRSRSSARPRAADRRRRGRGSPAAAHPRAARQGARDTRRPRRREPGARDPRRQRLHGGLADGAPAARRAVPHDLGGHREHLLPRRAARDRARRRARGAVRPRRARARRRRPRRPRSRSAVDAVALDARRRARRPSTTSTARPPTSSCSTRAASRSCSPTWSRARCCSTRPRGRSTAHGDARKAVVAAPVRARAAAPRCPRAGILDDDRTVLDHFDTDRPLRRDRSRRRREPRAMRVATTVWRMSPELDRARSTRASARRSTATSTARRPGSPTPAPAPPPLEWRLHPVAGYRPPKGVGPYDAVGRGHRTARRGRRRRRRCRSATNAARSHRCGTDSSASPSTSSTSSRRRSPRANTEMLGRAPDAVGLVDHERIGSVWERARGGVSIVALLLEELRNQLPRTPRPGMRETSLEPHRPGPRDLRREPSHRHVHACAPAWCRTSTSTSTASRASPALLQEIARGDGRARARRHRDARRARARRRAARDDAVAGHRDPRAVRAQGGEDLRHLPARRRRRHRRATRSRSWRTS